jgi:hypothetical protein
MTMASSRSTRSRRLVELNYCCARDRSPRNGYCSRATLVSDACTDYTRACGSDRSDRNNDGPGTLLPRENDNGLSLNTLAVKV